MADRQKVSQVITEVAYTKEGKLNVSQVLAEVAYTREGKLNVSQVFVEVAYTLADIAVDETYSTTTMGEVSLSDPASTANYRPFLIF